MFPLSMLRVVRHTSPQRHVGIPAPFEVIQQGCPLLQMDNSREMGADITPVSSTSLTKLLLNTVAHGFVLHKDDSLVPPKETKVNYDTISLWHHRANTSCSWPYASASGTNESMASLYDWINFRCSECLSGNITLDVVWSAPLYSSLPPNPYRWIRTLTFDITHRVDLRRALSSTAAVSFNTHGLIIDSIKKVQLPQQIDPSYNIIISTSTVAIIGHSQAEARIMGKENEVTLYKRTSIFNALGGVNSPGVSSIEIKELRLPVTYVSCFLWAKVTQSFDPQWGLNVEVKPVSGSSTL